MCFCIFFDYRLSSKWIQRRCRRWSARWWSECYVKVQVHIYQHPQKIFLFFTFLKSCKCVLYVVSDRRATIDESLTLALAFLKEIDGREIAHPLVPEIPNCWKVCFQFHRGCTDQCIVQTTNNTDSNSNKYKHRIKNVRQIIL